MNTLLIIGIVILLNILGIMVINSFHKSLDKRQGWYEEMEERWEKKSKS